MHADQLPIVQDLGVGDPWSELIGKVLQVRAKVAFRSGRININITEPGQLKILSNAEVEAIEAELAGPPK